MLEGTKGLHTVVLCGDSRSHPASNIYVSVSTFGVLL